MRLLPWSRRVPRFERALAALQMPAPYPRADGRATAAEQHRRPQPAATPDKQGTCVMVSNSQRAAMVNIAAYMISKAPQIHYAEQRSSTDPISSHGITSFKQLQRLLNDPDGEITLDCYEAVELIAICVGLPDLSGLDHDGQGYTGTLLDHLPHYTDISAGHPGAMLVFGSGPGVLGTGSHVCMVMQRDGDDPWLFSHGEEAGPFHIQLSDERTAHEGEPIVMLSISGL